VVTRPSTATWPDPQGVAYGHSSGPMVGQRRPGCRSQWSTWVRPTKGPDSHLRLPPWPCLRWRTLRAGWPTWQAVPRSPRTRPRWRRPARANGGRGFPVATMGSVPKAVCRTYNAVYRVLEIPCQLALARVIVRRTVGAACTLGFSKRGLARYEF
jgi:hypothetical protein